MIQFFKISKNFYFITFTLNFIFSLVLPLQAQTSGKIEQLDLSPEIIENSPILQRWQENIPNILEDIRHDPSFPTRIKLGYSFFPSSGDRSGWNIGIEDVFIERTRLTFSADYYASFDNNREAGGGEARYYVMPLGNYVNFAPTLGYRYIKSDDYDTDGLKVGARANFALSPQGAADLSISQSFISPGSEDEVGITNFSVNYAITNQLRISTEIERQNSQADQDSRLSINFELIN